MAIFTLFLLSYPKILPKIIDFESDFRILEFAEKVEKLKKKPEIFGFNFLN